MSTEGQGPHRFFAELKRRRVWRVAFAYGAGAFVVLQALAELILPAFGLPDTWLRALVFIAILGFPVAMLLGWLYDVGPRGHVHRTGGSDPATVRTARLALAAVVILSVGAGLVWVLRDLENPPPTRAQEASPALRAVGDPARAIRALAVLPLQDFSEGGGQAYFAAGMHEALIAALSRVSTLRVTSRTSVTRFAETDLSVPEIAAQLGVDAIVEGSVVRAGERVRITAQLIDAATDAHVWADSYEGDVADLLDLQARVADEIASAIEAELAPAAVDEPVVRTASADAQDAWMRGRYVEEQGTPDALRTAAENYEEAARADSGFVEAWTSLAGTRLLLAMEGEAVEDNLLQAASEVQRAIALDPSSSEAQAVLRTLVRVAERAGRDMDTRIQVRIDSTFADEEWLHAATDFGRRAALLQMEHPDAPQAPDVPVVMLRAARGQIAGGNLPAAIGILEELVERYPELPPAWLALRHAYLASEDVPAAVALEARRGEALDDPSAIQAAERLSRTIAADETRYWTWLVEQAGTDNGSAVDAAIGWAQLGRPDSAFAALQRAVSERDPRLAFVRRDPLLDPLRGDPRFQDLLSSMDARIARHRRPSPGSR
ncbi:MAG: hypothetical protein R3E98_05295 [Gemmatimonadota bacterium]|nr:hypothetical protein [Gemmatimonadota bacterium]